MLLQIPDSSVLRVGLINQKFELMSQLRTWGVLLQQLPNIFQRVFPWLSIKGLGLVRGHSNKIFWCFDFFRFYVNDLHSISCLALAIYGNSLSFVKTWMSMQLRFFIIDMATKVWPEVSSFFPRWIFILSTVNHWPLWMLMVQLNFNRIIVRFVPSSDFDIPIMGRHLSVYPWIPFEIIKV